MKLVRRKIFRWIIYITYITLILFVVRKIIITSKYGVNTEIDVEIFKDNNHTGNLVYNDSFIQEEKTSYEHKILEFLNNFVPKLGENGIPAFNSEGEKSQEKEIFNKKAINMLLSNKIPLRRKLLDVRDSMCQNVSYDSSLPTASIIIIFHNEGMSVLLRTVYSVLYETPDNTLKEIILVDDSSDEEELQGLLKYYIQTRLPHKVKLIRLTERQGLVRARLRGAQIATGKVLIFLDAHCEVTHGWAQPLLQRVKEKPNAVVMPIIDIISEDTFEYMKNDSPLSFEVGGFTWSGDFTWIKIQKQDLKSRSSPISPVNSPTMAGGLFAICRKYFWEIGSYDTQMDGWGGENLEMSFRIWQCGGVLEIVPCSRVGHIFRNFLPYKLPNNKDTHAINTARLVNVWMDEYKRLYYLYREDYKDESELIGDISDRLKLRKSLKCKSFKWYLENIYPEKFVLDENVQAYGRLQLQDKNLCLDNLQNEDVDEEIYLAVYTCHPKLYPSQYFALSNLGELRQEETCAIIKSANKSSSNRKVEMQICNEIEDDKEWIISEDGQLLHLKTGLCLDATNIKSGEHLSVAICQDTPGQFWQFDHYCDKNHC